MYNPTEREKLMSLHRIVVIATRIAPDVDVPEILLDARRQTGGTGRFGLPSVPARPNQSGETAALRLIDRVLPGGKRTLHFVGFHKTPAGDRHPATTDLVYTVRVGPTEEPCSGGQWWPVTVNLGPIINHLIATALVSTRRATILEGV